MRLLEGRLKFIQPRLTVVTQIKEKKIEFETIVAQMNLTRF